MKIEVSKIKPENFTEAYPGELSNSSHFECSTVIPNVLSLITTNKSNGKSNACFYAGTTFAGDAEHYYIILPNLGGPHTSTNILREKEFCVNFLSSKYYKACGLTIEHNGEDDDEIAAGGFTAKTCKTIRAARIEESTVSFECKLVSSHDILGDGKTVVYIGEVQLAHVEENIHLMNRLTGFDGFMYNINSAQNLLSKERMPYGAAYLTPFEI